MAALWSLRGLSPWELLKRTARESWQDEIFGRSARLVFYFFFSLFPALLLLLVLLSKAGPHLTGWRTALLAIIRQVLPPNASALVSTNVQQLNGEAVSGDGIGMAILGAIWGALNGTRALINGINKAYEVEEKRLWWRLVLLTCGIAFSLSSLGLIALAAVVYTSRAETRFNSHHRVPGALWDLGQWLIIACILFIAFSILYRFAPNLKQRRWQWSFPGAAFATALWIALALLLRAYQTHFNSSQKIYGNLTGVSTLLLWLYLTGAAIFIGGEANSEIEKAANGSNQQQDSPTAQRSGGQNN